MFHEYENQVRNPFPTYFWSNLTEKHRKWKWASMQSTKGAFQNLPLMDTREETAIN